MNNYFKSMKRKIGKFVAVILVVILSILALGRCKNNQIATSKIESVSEVTPTPTETPDTVEESQFKAYKVTFSGDDNGNVPKFDTVEEVEYKGDDTSLEGYILYEVPWQEHTDKYDPLDFDPEHADYPWTRAVYKYKLPKYYDYEEFKTAIKYCIHDYDYYEYVFGKPGKEQLIDNEYIFSYDKTSEFDNHFRISGVVYLIQKQEDNAK